MPVVLIFACGVLRISKTTIVFGESRVLPSFNQSSLMVLDYHSSRRQGVGGLWPTLRVWLSASLVRNEMILRYPSSDEDVNLHIPMWSASISSSFSGLFSRMLASRLRA